LHRALTWSILTLKEAIFLVTGSFFLKPPEVVYALRGVTMEPTRQRTKAGSRDKEFPTEWTLIDDAVSLQDEPQEEKSDSEEATGTMKAPLAARSHA